MADAPATPPTAPTPAAVPAGSVTLYEKGSLAPIVVDAADAPGHILSGNYGYAPGTRIPVRQAGKIGTVDADDLQNAVTNFNAKPVTGAQWHEHEQQKKYGSTLQGAEAFGVSALDSATLGISNAAIGAIGGKAAREHLRGITEANPTASTAGEVTGFVAPLAADVLSGGTLTPEIAAAEAARAGGKVAERGLVRTAAETAILGPTRALTKAGDLAEAGARALVGRNAESAAGRVAQNIIAGGARGAIEGGIAGVGAEAGHQYLQDNPDLSGEALASAFTHGAFIGGALGGALHGVGGMLTTKKAPALAGGVERAELGADEGAVRAADHGALPAEKTVFDQAADTILSQVDDPKSRATLKRAFDERGPHGFAKHDEMVGDAGRAVSKSLDEALEAGHTVDGEVFGMKASHMEKLVPAENLVVAKKAATSVWNDVTEVLDTLDSFATKGSGEASIKRLRKELADAMKVVEATNSPGAVMMEIDGIKRAVGREAKYGTNLIGRTDAAKEFGDRGKLYDRIKDVLEDESVFGPGAIAQRKVNAATTDMLGNANFFNKKYTVSFDNHAGEPVYRANDAAINGFMKDLTKPSGDLNTESFALKTERRRAYLDAVESVYDLTPKGKAAIATERKALDAMDKTIAKTSNDVAHVNQLKALLADEKSHHIGGIIGLAIDSVTKPGMSLARLAELEATKNRIVSKIDDGLASVKRALGGTGERKKPGLPPHDRDTYEKRRASVLHVASQPDQVQAHIAGTVGPMAQRAPATAAAFQQASIRTVQYLMAALPKPPPPSPTSLTPQLDMEAWQPNDQQKSQFNRQFDMATHPEHALKLVAAGTITPQHVQALQATNPQMYAMQAKKLRAELASRTKPVPFAMQAPIKTFLGIPQMDPETQKLMQANYQSSAPRQPGLKRPIKLADNTTLNASKE